MPSRNLNIIIVTAFVSVLCYAAHRRAKTAMIVGDALDLIDAYYVDPVDRDQLLIAAMKGMTETLDDHSGYISEREYESFQDSINQEFAGIGIFVEQPEEGQPVRVVTPLVGSPALSAGMLPADQIVRVNGEDVSSMKLHDVSKRLKGQVGTSVQLVIRRDNDEIEMTVRRGRIELESVLGDYRDEQDRWVYRLRDDPTIAYIHLTSFGEKTVSELERVLTDLDNDFSAIVLDLRGNGGGLLHSAVDVCDMFLNSGKIVSTRTRGGEIEDRFNAKPGTLVQAGKPVAVMIDGNSASASEIVAACLQDNGRAVVVGSRSFGKGTVQNILPLQYGRSALRLTVARYYRPNGKNIHRDKEASDEDVWGVSPDKGFAIDLDDDDLEKLAKRWREASYPSLVLAVPTPASQETPVEQTAEEGSTEVPPSDEPPADGSDNASNGEDAERSPDVGLNTDVDLNSDVDSNPNVDPQLKRALEFLRDAAND